MHRYRYPILVALATLACLFFSPQLRAQESAAYQATWQSLLDVSAAFISNPDAKERSEALQQLTTLSRDLAKDPRRHGLVIAIYTLCSGDLKRAAKANARPAVELANDQRQLYESFVTVFGHTANLGGRQMLLAESLVEATQQALAESGLAKLETRAIREAAKLFKLISNDVGRMSSRQRYLPHYAPPEVDVVMDDYFPHAAKLLEQLSTFLLNPDLAFYLGEEQGRAFMIKNLLWWKPEAQQQLLLLLVHDPATPLLTRRAAWKLEHEMFQLTETTIASAALPEPQTEVASLALQRLTVLLHRPALSKYPNRLTAPRISATSLSIIGRGTGEDVENYNQAVKAIPAEWLGGLFVQRVRPITVP